MIDPDQASIIGHRICHIFLFHIETTKRFNLPFTIPIYLVSRGPDWNGGNADGLLGGSGKGTVTKVDKKMFFFLIFNCENGDLGSLQRDGRREMGQWQLRLLQVEIEEDLAHV